MGLIATNGPQVAEGGYTQTLKRSTDMEDQTNIPNEEQTGRLQQTAVGGSAELRWRCMLCGRDRFTQKGPHKCVGGFRKRRIRWERVGQALPPTGRRLADGPTSTNSIRNDERHDQR